MISRQSIPQPVRQSTDAGRVFPSGVRIDKVPYGLGVFAFAFIPKGTPIGRVPGKVIDDPDYGSDYCISAGEGKVLEPGPPFCYLNHSCEPNCQLMQYVREEDEKNDETLEIGALSGDEMDFDDDDEDEHYVDAVDLDDDECFFGDGAAEERCDADLADMECDESDPAASEEDGLTFEEDADAEIWVESLRDILPDEELTIDYAWPADRAARCLCGSARCRGWIVDPEEMQELLQTE